MKRTKDQIASDIEGYVYEETGPDGALRVNPVKGGYEITMRNCGGYFGIFPTAKETMEFAREHVAEWQRQQE